jgi:hypothetical protein
MSNTLRFGPPIGAAAVVIYQNTKANQSVTSQYGAAAMYGIAKRGPMGKAIPVRGAKQYQEIFGDPGNNAWHLFSGSDHLMPDAIDGFYAAGGDQATLFVTRLDLDGKARKAELTINGRNGLPVLKISAANEGRWGGTRSKIAATPVTAATVRTLTLVVPGLLANEYRGGSISMTGISKIYKVVSNTAADPATGEAVFTVAAQFNLFTDGVTGPVPLTGTASYTKFKAKTGTVAYALKSALTGIVAIADKLVVGTGTLFTTELSIGDNIYWGTQRLVVESIANDTTLTITEPVGSASGVSLQRDNLNLVGTGTAFVTEYAVGDSISIASGANYISRKIAAITSATALKLESGFPDALTAAPVFKLSLEVTGTGTAFTNALIGTYLVDPYRSTGAVKVTAVASATSLSVSAPFSKDFSGVAVSRQTQLAEITLDPEVPTDGLSVSISQGVRLPETHFSMSVFYNGRQVMYLEDLSLDPADKYFVEDAVAIANVAYDDGNETLATYITAENLWTSAYTTSIGSDVRPSSGNGSILAVAANKLYTVADVEYASLSGELLYPSAYDSPSSYYRINSAQAPVFGAGTYNTVAVAVSGTGTLFTTEFAAGDYLYEASTKTARKILSVNSDTSMTLVSAFPANASGSAATKCGYIAVSINTDLATATTVGTEFVLSVRKYLTGGYDGNTANLNNNYWLKYADPDFNHLETAATALSAGFVRVLCPGVSDSSIQRAFADYCNARAYEFRVEFPSYMNAAQAESFIRNDIGRSDAITAAFPSYGYSNDPLVSNRDRLTPITGDVLGGESRKAIADQGYHKMLAGIGNTLPTRIKRLSAKIDAREEANLNQRGIQPVKKVDGRFCIWGIRAPSVSEQYKFINSGRIQKNLIRVFRESTALLRQLFELNEPNTVTQLIFILNAYAAKEFTKGVFTKYLPFADAVNVANIANSSADTNQSLIASLIDLQNGKLSLSFGYTPSGLLELIEIYVTPDATAGKFGAGANTAF